MESRVWKGCWRLPQFAFIWNISHTTWSVVSKQSMPSTFNILLVHPPLSHLPSGSIHWCVIQVLNKFVERTKNSLCKEKTFTWSTCRHNIDSIKLTFFVFWLPVLRLLLLSVLARPLQPQWRQGVHSSAQYGWRLLPSPLKKMMEITHKYLSNCESIQS